MKKYQKLILLIFLFINKESLLAQTKSVTVNCGMKIQPSFAAGDEVQEIKIHLNAGDKLYFRVTPTGDYLNVRAVIKDPGNGMIFPDDPYQYVEPMFTEHSRTLEITTGKLSATGTYTILLYNYYKKYKHDTRSGEYTFVTTCYKKDGTVIEN